MKQSQLQRGSGLRLSCCTQLQPLPNMPTARLPSRPGNAPESQAPVVSSQPDICPASHMQPSLSRHPCPAPAETPPPPPQRSLAALATLRPRIAAACGDAGLLGCRSSAHLWTPRTECALGTAHTARKLRCDRQCIAATGAVQDWQLCQKKGWLTAGLPSSPGNAQRPQAPAGQPSAMVIHALADGLSIVRMLQDHLRPCLGFTTEGLCPSMTL